MDTLSRNALCPCGSGKKYKRCCLGNAEPATTEQGRLAHVRHTAVNAITDQVVAFARRRFGDGWVDAALREVAGTAPPGQGELETLLQWLIYHWPIEGAPPAAHFVAERGSRLTEQDRLLITCNLASWFTMWEVRRVEPGVGMELFDLLTHETRFVHEVRGSHSLRQWFVLLGSVTDYPDVSGFGGVHPQVLLPTEWHIPLAQVRGALGVRTRKVPVARLRAPEVQVAMLRSWWDAVEAQALRLSTPGILNNTDGDPLMICTDQFAFPSGKRAELLAQLTAIEGAELDESEDDAAVVFTRPGNQLHKSWDNTIVGRTFFKGSRLLAESNSVARADALRRKLEAAAGELLSHESRDLRSLDELMKNPLKPAPRRARKPELAPAELAALTREMLDREYEGWEDTKIPALGDRTPRQAAASATLRPQLVALLKDYELHETAKPEAERFDFGRLWRAVGLDPRSAPDTGRATRGGSPGRSSSATAVAKRPRVHAGLFEFKITLRDVDPPVWRRVRVRDNLTLARFHDVLQRVMGWTDSHLHLFEVSGREFGVRDPDFPDRQSEKKTLLSDVLHEPGATMVYEYDFGDGWLHDVVLEQALPPDPGGKFPYVLDGKRACPPEDCGGADGYASLLQTLANPSDPEHEACVEWVGGSFDPEEFDARALNLSIHGGWYLPEEGPPKPRSKTALPRRTPA